MSGITTGLMSSETDEWATPQWLFDEVNQWLQFTLDPCATPENAKCDKFFTKKSDGLAQSWAGHTVWMNPPYGREIGRWVRKAYEEADSQQGTTVCCLLPARTDTEWWHKYVMRATRIQFIRGRIRFVGSADNSAPFPSCLVDFMDPHGIGGPFKVQSYYRDYGNLTLEVS